MRQLRASRRASAEAPRRAVDAQYALSPLSRPGVEIEIHPRRLLGARRLDARRASLCHDRCGRGRALGARSNAVRENELGDAGVDRALQRARDALRFLLRFRARAPPSVGSGASK
jgi:hypothetical protein